jgi:hypothetical protein
MEYIGWNRGRLLDEQVLAKMARKGVIAKDVITGRFLKTKGAN